MCAKSRNIMIVPTLRNGTDLKPQLQNTKLPLSSNVKTVGITTDQTAISFLHAHFPSSPMCRIDPLSWEAMVLPANQQGKIVRPTGRAKTGVDDSKGIAFYAVSLAIGRQNVPPMAGYNLCLRRYLSSKNCSQKTERWAVCRSMWAGKLICWVAC